MPSGFNIGPVTIHFYGIIIMLGALAASWLATVEAKRRNIDPDLVWDMLPWLLIGGIIGARLWHVIFPPASMGQDYYLIHPLQAFAIWNGGLGIYGAVIGGFVALIICLRIKKGSLLTWIDIIAPGLALAQAVGRWGNFVNQELYGLPTKLPWGIYIDPQHRLPGYEQYSYYHPLFLYESLCNLVNMGLLLVLGRKLKDWLKPGDLFLIYLVVYPVERFLLEFIRIDIAPVGTFDINQLMILVSVASAVIFVWRHWVHKAKTVTES
jgi:phosphatidylglycerol:prolipoprotein diacylglycerol transferase